MKILQILCVRKVTIWFESIPEADRTRNAGGNGARAIIEWNLFVFHKRKQRR